MDRRGTCWIVFGKSVDSTLKVLIDWDRLWMRMPLEYLSRVLSSVRTKKLGRIWKRRSIFNSPPSRLFRLGKRRKSSVCSQQLAPPPADLPRHHSFSGHHSPYPAEEVAKTQSHERLQSALSQESSPKFERRPNAAPLAEKDSLHWSEDLEKKVRYMV
ncbi:hypothetical protein AVEN_184098-2 [Araneus ventricosus]|uniref:Uncharacterized protein n=1 Tax=Araneus ventricosus TaxID=182803 RepID=A0A4Y2CZX0_ARAVE|nr:hypothetical protein AVEN_184098-2 [Araneus ventricosus]